MLLSRNKKNNVYPCKTQFYYIKGDLNGSKLCRLVFVMWLEKDVFFLFVFFTDICILVARGIQFMNTVIIKVAGSLSFSQFSFL